MIFLLTFLKSEMQKTQVIKPGFIAFEFFHTAKQLIRTQRVDTFILIRVLCCVKEIFWNLPHAATISR